MKKAIKPFLLLNLMFFSISLTGIASSDVTPDWQEVACKKQKYVGVHDPLPTGLTYTIWKDGIKGGEKETAEIKGPATILTVPGAFTPTCENQISAFVKAYKDETSELSTLQVNGTGQAIPTYVVMRNDMDVAATWARALWEEEQKSTYRVPSSKDKVPESDKLIFVPDADLAIGGKLGALEDAKARLKGVILHRSVIYVNRHGNIVGREEENNNAETNKTSVEEVLKFWKGYFTLRGRTDDIMATLKAEEQQRKQSEIQAKD